MTPHGFKHLLREIVHGYTFDIVGLLDVAGKVHSVPTESSFLAKLIEVGLLEFLTKSLSKSGLTVAHGGERTYPDLEAKDKHGNLFAVDIKCASVSPNTGRFNSRPTLYSFGTYLTQRDQTTSGILRPYNDYRIHLNVMAIYDVNRENPDIIADLARVPNLEKVNESHPIFRNLTIFVVESWRVASHLMSSRTRSYVGAINDIDRFQLENGVFRTVQGFLSFWERVPRNGGADRLNKIFGNTRTGASSSHCTVEELAQLLGRDADALAVLINSDEAFPVFTPDTDSYALDSKVMPGHLVYPYIAASYLNVPPKDIEEIEKRLADMRQS